MDIFIFDEICISTLDNVKRMGALIGATSAPSLASLFPSRKLSPPFQNISFFFGVETPLKQNPSEAFSFW